MANRPRVLLTRRWPAPVETVLAEEFDTVFNPHDEPLSAEALRAGLAEFDAICPTVTDRLDESVLTLAIPRARLIANFGVGFNHIDVALATARGMTVTNTPGVLTECTADLAMTLLLMTARRAGEGERELRAGQWTGWRPTHLLGTRVAGKTIGIVGAGRIGLAVARRARFGFGMRVLLHNRSAVAEDKLVTLEAEQCELDTLLDQADFVSLHCPATPETRHLIDADRLSQMRSGAILINTARGEVVDELALVEALERGSLAGAGLDVYENEPVVNSRLLGAPHIVLLPHLGSASKETRVAMGLCAVDNLRAYFAGDEPPNRI